MFIPELEPGMNLILQLSSGYNKINLLYISALWDSVRRSFLTFHLCPNPFIYPLVPCIQIPVGFGRHLGEARLSCREQHSSHCAFSCSSVLLVHKRWKYPSVWVSTFLFYSISCILQSKRRCWLELDWLLRVVLHVVPVEFWLFWLAVGIIAFFRGDFKQKCLESSLCKDSWGLRALVTHFQVPPWVMASQILVTCANSFIWLRISFVRGSVENQHGFDSETAHEV